MSRRHGSWRTRLGVIAVAPLVAALALARATDAQTFTSGSTGADGPFAPAASVTVPVPPDGVFNFTTIDIPAGVTVRFGWNAANTPVTLLASGDVTIAGEIDVSGESGRGASLGAFLGETRGLGGPGGFPGGSASNTLFGSDGSAGHGPGGGLGGRDVNDQPYAATGGGFGTPGAGGSSPEGPRPGGPAYGFPTLLPVIGGSGGGGGNALPRGGNTAGGGGGGGGAVLIASSGTIRLTGTIRARGGAGGSTGAVPLVGAGAGGSGGAIRLVATAITGSGALDLRGGDGQSSSGGLGRVRLEAFSDTLAVTDVVPSRDRPGFVTLPSVPTLRITAIDGVTAPVTPTGSYTTPDMTLSPSAGPISVTLAGAQVPPGTQVTVRVAARNGDVSTTTALLSGTLASTTASASVTIPTEQPSVISASVTFTVVAANGGPVFAGGEVVERVRVSAGADGRSRVTYVARSGRELVVATR